jgi:hypothetical protein
MQQAKGLARARIHRHTGGDEVVAYFQKLNTQMTHGRIQAGAGEFCH